MKTIFLTTALIGTTVFANPTPAQQDKPQVYTCNTSVATTFSQNSDLDINAERFDVTYGIPALIASKDGKSTIYVRIQACGETLLKLSGPTCVSYAASFFNGKSKAEAEKDLMNPDQLIFGNTSSELNYISNLGISTPGLKLGQDNVIPQGQDIISVDLICWKKDKVDIDKK